MSEADRAGEAGNCTKKRGNRAKHGREGGVDGRTEKRERNDRGTKRRTEEGGHRVRSGHGDRSGESHPAMTGCQGRPGYAPL